MENHVNPEKPKRSIKWWQILIIIIVLFGVIGSCSNSADKSESSSLPESPVSELPVQNMLDAKSDSADSNSSDAAKVNDGWIKSGMYKVGKDIDADEYYVISDGAMCYIEVSKDSKGTLESIISNDNINTHSFVTVSDGQYFTVRGGKFISASRATVPAAQNGEYAEGTYRVGEDIPAGEYKVKCTNNLMCYIEVSKDSKGTLESIISNDNIQDESYITVSDGQYLTVTGGVILV